MSEPRYVVSSVTGWRINPSTTVRKTASGKRTPPTLWYVNDRLCNYAVVVEIAERGNTPREMREAQARLACAELNAQWERAQAVLDAA